MIPILIGAFLFVILVFWVDPRATDRTLFYVLPLTIIAALGVYAHNYSRQKWMFGATIIGFFCVVAVFLFLTLYLANSTPILSYIRKVSMFTIPLLIILGVAALYPVIQVWASHQNGIVQGILNLILFLPCAVRDMFDFIVREFHITTSTTRVILLVQIGLFLLYFGGPALYNKIAQWGGDSYLYKDTFLFGRTTPNRIIIRDKSYFQKHPLTNYTVSFWVFQNGTRLENEFHSVLNYGERPHVRVLYDQLQISTDTSTAILHIPLQKWVHVVCVYEQNKCKLYVDGEFISVMDLPATPFTFPMTAPATAKVTLGDNTLRGNGGIRAIKAKLFPMTQYQIRMEQSYLRVE